MKPKITNRKTFWSAVVASAVLTSYSLYLPAATRSDSLSSYWLENGKKAASTLSQGVALQKAKNVIVFIGDGMGLSTVAAARILEGQIKGQTGEENSLSFETYPNVALSKTYNTNAQVGDSAGTITAIMTGSKTRIGMIGIGPEQHRGLCQGSKNYRLKTLLEKAEENGLSTGVVTTTRITHATPAGNYAHVAERDWEADSSLPPEALAAGCSDIAKQLIDFPYGDGIDVLFGGGRQQLTPLTEVDPEYPLVYGKRNDGRNLIKDWLKKSGTSSQYVWNREQFLKSAAQSKGKILGLFEPSHMNYESNRLKDPAGEPSLSEMAVAAVKRLAQNEKGYFLMVEAGRIDHAHHENRAGLALHEAIELSNAVRQVEKNVDLSNTLIIVTADHGHVMTMSGYPVRGNPILGKVFDIETSSPAKDLAGRPFTTLNYANGPGAWATAENPSLARPDLSDVDTEDLAFVNQAGIPLASETHSGEDVAIYAKGAGSSMFHGVVEQNVIFHVIEKAMGGTARIGY